MYLEQMGSNTGTEGKKVNLAPENQRVNEYAAGTEDTVSGGVKEPVLWEPQEEVGVEDHL